mmetsp:Transcript_46138/g.73319  ORF Transcript_46138/g.73319 Transcript_46138/m.73319 type:complete len:192 (+) Transcript_46138:22-597(+)
MAVPPQVLSLPGDILREASKSSAEVFGDIKTFLLLLGDERCKSLKAVGPGKIELIVVVETVVLHILIQVWDGGDEYGATSWVSFRDLFRHDSVRLHKFVRFLEGSWNSFSTAQFSANSLDESDLEELLDEEEGKLLPLQGAWNEVYSGYGAYTKFQHRRGNSLDDMDSGKIEDTRGSRGPASWQKKRSVSA